MNENLDWSEFLRTAVVSINFINLNVTSATKLLREKGIEYAKYMSSNIHCDVFFIIVIYISLYRIGGGIHCAPVAHKTLGSSDKGGTLRFSFGHENTIHDMEFALSIVKEIAKQFNN